jgi:hypothetical protein
MSTAQEPEGSELVVPGDPTCLAGSLPDFPDVTCEDFERASELARRDAGEM